MTEIKAGKAEGAPSEVGARMRPVWVRLRDRPAIVVVARDVDGHAIYDGCVILGRSQKLQAAADAVAAAPGAADTAALGTVVVDTGLLWPGQHGGPYEVPYLFHPGLEEARRDLVRQAAVHWAERTNIRFRPRAGDADRDYIVFAPRGFCASAVGRQGGEQEIWLSSDCILGNVIHEIGHAVGLWHEHTRIDRDRYVEVGWTNISPAARPNFVVRSVDSRAHGDYDYNSIMHYPAYAFPIDAAKPTLVTPQGASIGQRAGLSDGDVAAISSLYP